MSNYFTEHKGHRHDAIEALLMDSGVRCVRISHVGAYSGPRSHAAALRRGIVPILKTIFNPWEEVRIGTPSLVEKIETPWVVMGQIEHFYHNPIYPRGRSPEEFASLNGFLFPEGHKYECYGWSDDWCEFFDMGKEWFGTGCWSVYDMDEGEFTLLYVSDTD